MTRFRSCLFNLLFAGVVMIVVGVSAYLSFRVFVRGESVRVPELTGLRMAEARATLSDSGLEISLDDSRDAYSDEIPIDAVVWQSVDPGQRVKRGSRVLVARSLGPLVTKVPNLASAPARSALVELSDRGLSLRTISQMQIDGVDGIVATTPPAGTDVGRQAEVSVLVSDSAGATRWVMPDLVDDRIDEVRPTLEKLGFRLAPLRYETYPGIGDGIIIRQSPLSGYPVTRETLITLTVSRGGEAMTEEPATTLNPWEDLQ